VGDDDQRAPFFKWSSEYSNKYLVASATCDPFKSKLDFQAICQYSNFAVGAASQYCLRSGQNENEKSSCWMPPALKALWRSDEESLEFGLKYIPARQLPPTPAARITAQAFRTFYRDDSVLGIIAKTHTPSLPAHHLSLSTSPTHQVLTPCPRCPAQ
jgi:hypothetical protein